MRRIRLLILGSFALAAVAVFLTANSKAGLPIPGQEPEPGGMMIGVMPDQQQFPNPAIPVAVFSTVFGRSEPGENEKPKSVIKAVILENRSSKEVSAVTVRWVIAPSSSRTVSLARGEFKPHDLPALRKTLRAGQRQTLKLSAHPRLFDLIKAIPNVEAMGNQFVFLIGVAKVVFEDGTSWKEEVADASNKSAAAN